MRPLDLCGVGFDPQGAVDICLIFWEDFGNMRNKKLLSVILAASMVMSMNSFTFADEIVEVSESGKVETADEYQGSGELLGEGIESVGAAKDPIGKDNFINEGAYTWVRNGVWATGASGTNWTYTEGTNTFTALTSVELLLGKDAPDVLNIGSPDATQEGNTITLCRDYDLNKIVTLKKAKGTSAVYFEVANQFGDDYDEIGGKKYEKGTGDADKIVGYPAGALAFVNEGENSQVVYSAIANRNAIYDSKGDWSEDESSDGFSYRHVASLGKVDGTENVNIYFGPVEPMGFDGKNLTGLDVGAFVYESKEEAWTFDNSSEKDGEWTFDGDVPMTPEAEKYDGENPVNLLTAEKGEDGNGVFSLENVGLNGPGLKDRDENVSLIVSKGSKKLTYATIEPILKSGNGNIVVGYGESETAGYNLSFENLNKDGKTITINGGSDPSDVIIIPEGTFSYKAVGTKNKDVYEGGSFGVGADGALKNEDISRVAVKTNDTYSITWWPDFSSSVKSKAVGYLGDENGKDADGNDIDVETSDKKAINNMIYVYRPLTISPTLKSRGLATPEVYVDWKTVSEDLAKRNVLINVDDPENITISANSSMDDIFRNVMNGVEYHTKNYIVGGEVAGILPMNDTDYEGAMLVNEKSVNAGYNGGAKISSEARQGTLHITFRNEATNVEVPVFEDENGEKEPEDLTKYGDNGVISIDLKIVDTDAPKPNYIFSTDAVEKEVGTVSDGDLKEAIAAATTVTKVTGDESETFDVTLVSENVVGAEFYAVDEDGTESEEPTDIKKVVETEGYYKGLIDFEYEDETAGKVTSQNSIVYVTMKTAEEPTPDEPTPVDPSEEIPEDADSYAVSANDTAVEQFSDEDALKNAITVSGMWVIFEKDGEKKSKKIEDASQVVILNEVDLTTVGRKTAEISWNGVDAEVGTDSINVEVFEAEVPPVPEVELSIGLSSDSIEYPADMSADDIVKDVLANNVKFYEDGAETAKPEGMALSFNVVSINGAEASEIAEVSENDVIEYFVSSIDADGDFYMTEIGKIKITATVPEFEIYKLAVADIKISQNSTYDELLDKVVEGATIDGKDELERENFTLSVMEETGDDLADMDSDGDAAPTSDGAADGSEPVDAKNALAEIESLLAVSGDFVLAVNYTDEKGSGDAQTDVTVEEAEKPEPATKNYDVTIDESKLTVSQGMVSADFIKLVKENTTVSYEGESIDKTAGTLSVYVIPEDLSEEVTLDEALSVSGSFVIGVIYEDEEGLGSADAKVTVNPVETAPEEPEHTYTISMEKNAYDVEEGTSAEDVWNMVAGAAKVTDETGKEYDLDGMAGWTMDILTVSGADLADEMFAASGNEIEVRVVLSQLVSGGLTGEKIAESGVVKLTVVAKTPEVVEPEYTMMVLDVTVSQNTSEADFMDEVSRNTAVLHKGEPVEVTADDLKVETVSGNLADLLAVSGNFDIKVSYEDATDVAGVTVTPVEKAAPSENAADGEQTASANAAVPNTVSIDGVKAVGSDIILYPTKLPFVGANYKKYLKGTTIVSISGNNSPIKSIGLKMKAGSTGTAEIKSIKFQDGKKIKKPGITIQIEAYEVTDKNASTLSGAKLNKKGKVKGLKASFSDIKVGNQSLQNLKAKKVSPKLVAYDSAKKTVTFSGNFKGTISANLIGLG